MGTVTPSTVTRSYFPSGGASPADAGDAAGGPFSLGAIVAAGARAPLSWSSALEVSLRPQAGRATIDAARIERCWRTGAFNIGVACGPSGVYVLDLDTPKHDTRPPAAPFDEPGIKTGADSLAHLVRMVMDLEAEQAAT